MSSTEPRGPEIGRRSDLLYRQIREIHIQDGRVTSAAFKPATSDQGLPSVNASWKTTAEVAMARATALGLVPVAVYAVSCDECYDLGLKAWEDPEDGPPPDPSHSVIDFRQHGRGAQDSKGKKLREKALERGCQHPIGLKLTAA